MNVHFFFYSLIKKGLNMATLGIFTLEDLLTELGNSTQKKIKLPPKYKVILKNDDFTTMEFVVFVLKAIFSKSEQEAEKIMFDIHNNGSAVVGVYPEEIATTKVALCMSTAKSYNFPLECICEPDE